jgi:hypothetical protein
MPDDRADHGNMKGARGVPSDTDAVLVEEFCSLVAEIAARSLTRRHQERDNGAGSESRR